MVKGKLRGESRRRENLCHTTDCYRPALGEYCYHCQLERDKVYCKNPPCHEKIFKNEKLCSNCKNNKDAVRLSSCNTCYLNYYYGDKYGKCRNHGNRCLSCNDRIPEWYKYCSKHINSCLTCSTRIASGQKYCSTHQEPEKLKSLVQQRTSLSNPQEVIRFEPWWNNNMATVVNHSNGYWVFLVVYVKENDTVKVFPESHSCSCWGDSGKGRKNHSYLSDAQNEATWLREQLTSSSKYKENPILLIHPQANSYVSFNSLITGPYVLKEEIGKSFCYNLFPLVTIGAYQVLSNLDDYFKPLDIIRVKKVNWIVNKDYFHVGIYLGKNAICHISDPTGLISEENLQVRITGWDAFLNGWLGTPVNGRAGELQRYRPIIPFKHYKKSIEQAAKAYWADYGAGKYDLYNDNCEHFANAIVYGIYYSEQAGDTNLLKSSATKIWDEIWTKNFNFVCKIFQPNHWGTLWRDAPILRAFNSSRYKVNNKLPGVSTSICLKNEVNSWDTNGKFTSLTSNELRDRREEYERQYLMEIPIKQECKIM